MPPCSRTRPQARQLRDSGLVGLAGCWRHCAERHPTLADVAASQPQLRFSWLPFSDPRRVAKCVRGHVHTWPLSKRGSARRAGVWSLGPPHAATRPHNRRAPPAARPAVLRPPARPPAGARASSLTSCRAAVPVPACMPTSAAWRRPYMCLYCFISASMHAPVQRCLLPFRGWRSVPWCLVDLPFPCFPSTHRLPTCPTTCPTPGQPCPCLFPPERVSSRQHLPDRPTAPPQISGHSLLCSPLQRRRRVVKHGLRQPAQLIGG
jgi:hypothetical protein